MKVKIFREHGEVLHNQISAYDWLLRVRKQRRVVEETAVIEVVNPVEQAPPPSISVVRPAEVAEEEPRTLTVQAHANKKFIVAVSAFDEQTD